SYTSSYPSAGGRNCGWIGDDGTCTLDLSGTLYKDSCEEYYSISSTGRDRVTIKCLGGTHGNSQPWVIYPFSKAKLSDGDCQDEGRCYTDTAGLTYNLVAVAPVSQPLNVSSISEGAITLSWISNKDPDLGGYKIFYKTGSSSEPYESPISVPKTSTSYTLQGFNGDLTYFFVIKSYNSNNEIIDTSNELKVMSRSMSLSEGWNIASLPVLPVDRSVKDLFPEATAAFGFDNGGYTPLNLNNAPMEKGKGYWIYMPEAKTYTITGTSIDYFRIMNAKSGWSLVGSCSSQALPYADDGSIRAIFGFGDNKYSFFDTGSTPSQLGAGKGFWINLSKDTTLRLEGQ
ncbi:MAG: fibronectin type III domain-containing protein, partial [bacterium]